jgi:hypothetical protein
MKKLNNYRQCCKKLSILLFYPLPDLPPKGKEQAASCKAFPPWGKRERGCPQKYPLKGKFNLKQAAKITKIRELA